MEITYTQEVIGSAVSSSLLFPPVYAARRVVGSTTRGERHIFGILLSRRLSPNAEINITLSDFTNY